MKEHAPESTEESATAVATAPARGVALAPGPVVARVVALQRAAGNQAVNRWLARADPLTGTVSKEISEELIAPSDSGEKTFHWTAKFAYEITDDEIVGIINVRTYPDKDVTADEATKVRQEARTEFQRLFNGKFVIEEEVTGFNNNRTLKLGVNFLGELDKDPEHLSVAIHKGKGADNRQNWYVGSPGIAHAHELAHGFGLKDEYLDFNVKGRETSGAADVREDHSIMGNFPDEGVDKAAMKDRHALRIAKLIFAAAGKPDAELTVHVKK